MLLTSFAAIDNKNFFLSTLARVKRSASLSVLLLTAAGLATTAQQSMAQQTEIEIEDDVRSGFEAVLADPRVIDALAELEIREPEAIQEQFRLTEIPAPPFKEERRAAYFLEQLKARGLEDAYIDSEGNAIGVRKGSGNGPLLLIATFVLL